MTVHAIDLSNSGIRVESSEPIEQHTEVFVRAERYGLTGSTSVRHCGRRGSKYVLGLEFNPESGSPDMDDAEAFVDYYELLQISPNAEPDTIHRVFRIMAARYHPDNKETGNSEKFFLLTKAYAVVSDPAAGPLTMTAIATGVPNRCRYLASRSSPKVWKARSTVAWEFFPYSIAGGERTLRSREFQCWSWRL